MRSRNFLPNQDGIQILLLCLAYHFYLFQVYSGCGGIHLCMDLEINFAVTGFCQRIETVGNQAGRDSTQKPGAEILGGEGV